MGDVIATPVRWQSLLQLSIADRQPRGIHLLNARDSLGGLPGLIDCILAGYRPGKGDHAVGCRNVHVAIGRSRRNLRLHGSRDLTV